MGDGQGTSDGWTERDGGGQRGGGDASAKDESEEGWGIVSGF